MNKQADVQICGDNLWNYYCCKKRIIVLLSKGQTYRSCLNIYPGWKHDSAGSPGTPPKMLCDGR